MKHLSEIEVINTEFDGWFTKEAYIGSGYKRQWHCTRHGVAGYLFDIQGKAHGSATCRPEMMAPTDTAAD